jgi:hypothetical protein
MDDNIDNISQWVYQYDEGYTKYMTKYYPELYRKFEMNIHPPQRIGGCMHIGQGRIHSDEDYAEIMKVTKEFCEKYPNPINFPKDF